MWMDGLEDYAAPSKCQCTQIRASEVQMRRICRYRFFFHIGKYIWDARAVILRCSTFVLLHFSLWKSSLQKKKWKSDAATNYKCFCAGSGILGKGETIVHFWKLRKSCKPSHICRLRQLTVAVYFLQKASVRGKYSSDKTLTQNSL